MSAINADKTVFLDTVCVIESACVSTGDTNDFFYQTVFVFLSCSGI